MIIIFIFLFCGYLYIKNKTWNPKALFQKQEKIIIFGHRGAPKYEKENTLVSFKKAIELGADGIELDVQKSKDNVLLIHHDEYLDDKSSTIQENKYFQIQKIQQKTPLNILNQISTILFKIDILNIEIKSRTIFNKGIEKDVLNFINQNKIEKKTIISSFNPLVLYKLKKLNKNVKIGYLFTKEDVHWIIKTYFWANIIKPDVFNVDINYLNKNIATWCQKKKIPLFVFTVNTKEEFLYVKKIGAQGIFTDDPQKMKQLIK